MHMQLPLNGQASPPLTSLPAWPCMAQAAHYGLAGDIVQAIAPYTEADPTAILVQLLVAYGNVIGHSPHIKVEADRHSTNLFVCLVGATGKSRRGTSWGHVRQLFV